MKIVVKNKYWNPFFAIERTSVFKELKTTIEKELQLLLASSFSKIKVYKNRPKKRFTPNARISRQLCHTRHVAGPIMF